jgi:hypothetical protein
MNLMVKNVNSLNLGFVVLSLLYFVSQHSFAQEEFGISQKKYEIISGVWPDSYVKNIKLNEKTLGYEVWMDEVWGDEFSTTIGVGFCLFEYQNLAKAFKDLRISVKNLEIKKFSKNLIDDRFDLKRRPKIDKVLTLSEPIILGDFAFLFFRSKKDKGLYVQKKNSEGNWDPECGVTLHGELH